VKYFLSDYSNNILKVFAFFGVRFGDKTDDLCLFVMATDFNDSGCGIFWIC
jgi:hypothetical protein